MGIPWSFKRNFLGAKEIKDTNDYLSRIGRAIGSLDYMPVGFSMPWWSDTLPSSKYMFMEGQSLASYPEAKAVFGNNLPDLRGRVMVHKSTDTEFDAILETGGSKYSEAHDHTVRMSVDSTPTPGNFYGYPVLEFTMRFQKDGDFGAAGSVPGTGLTGTTGTGNAGNLQPYIVCRYIAKVLP
jgi:hypothetical protein